jgi:alkyl hydroperoxide reductase subunit D
MSLDALKASLPEYAKDLRLNLESVLAGLRMNVMRDPGIDKASFELCALAVSAINGCGACVDSHEKTVREHGVSAQGVQSAARIAAVVHAVAVTLEQA